MTTPLMSGRPRKITEEEFYALGETKQPRWLAWLCKVAKKAPECDESPSREQSISVACHARYPTTR